jgi:hypothetical protein
VGLAVVHLPSATFTALIAAEAVAVGLLTGGLGQSALVDLLLSVRDGMDYSGRRGRRGGWRMEGGWKGGREGGRRRG